MIFALKIKEKKMRKKLIGIVSGALSMAVMLSAVGCGGNAPCAHGNTKTEVITPSTCTHAGLSKTVCRDCGVKLNEFETAELGHDFGEWGVYIPATCEDDGQEKRVCSRNCAEEGFEETRITNALGHEFGEPVEKTPATCKTYGISQKTCDRDCTMNVYTDRLQHTPNSEGVCDTCGEKAYSVGLAFVPHGENNEFYSVGIGECVDENVVIPAYWNGKAVVDLAYEAFAYKTFIKTITIPETITTCNIGVFNGCTNLNTVYWNAVNCADFFQKNWIFLRGENAVPMKVVFGALVERIPARMFFPLHSDVNAIPQISEVQFVQDGNLKTIGEYAFYKTPLAKITLPDNVTEIGSYAFASSKLGEVKLSKNLKHIEDYAFSDNGNLASVDFGKSILTIGKYAFDYCVKLQEVDLSGVSQAIGENAFKNCLALESIVFSPKIKGIPDRAFYGCVSLTGIVIPDFVESIGEEAFANCANVESITIGKAVKNVGEGAFDGLSKATVLNYNAVNCADFISGNKTFRNLGTLGNGLQVNFGALVEQIPARLLFATSDVAALPKVSTISLGSNLTKVGDYAFFGLQCGVTYSGTNGKWQNVVKGVGNDCLATAVIGG